MPCVYGVERESYLIKLSFGQLAAQSVIDYLKIRLLKLRCLLEPHVRELAALKRDRAEPFPLPLVIHSAEDYAITVPHERERERSRGDAPIPLGVTAEDPPDRSCERSEGTVAIRYIRFAHCDEVSTFVLHEAQYVMLRGFVALARACRSAQEDVAAFALRGFAEAWIGGYADIHVDFAPVFGDNAGFV